MRKFLPFLEKEKIGIQIDDFRIMYSISKELTSWGFNFEFLKTNDPIPQDLSIILISPGALKTTFFEKNIHVIEVSGEIKDLVAHLLLHIAEKKLFNQVIHQHFARVIEA